MAVHYSFHSRSFKTSLFCFGASLLLWGCSAKETYEFAPACPNITVLPSAADYYTFANQHEDIAHLINRANIIRVQGNCIDDPHNGKKTHKKNEEINLTLVMKIYQGPASQKNHVTIPYFIATLHNGKLENKKELKVEVNFPDNVDQMIIRTGRISFEFPLTAERTPDGYELVVGYQLSPEQLNYNRQHFRSTRFEHF